MVTIIRGRCRMPATPTDWYSEETAAAIDAMCRPAGWTPPVVEPAKPPPSFIFPKSVQRTEAYRKVARDTNGFRAKPAIITPDSAHWRERQRSWSGQ